MKTFVLLGAGASVEAGVPDAYDMTRSFIKLFNESSIRGKYYHVFCFVVGGLLFQKGVQGKNPFEGLNIEEVFSAIELLSERSKLEAAPFIGYWHPLVEQLDIIKYESVNKIMSMKERSQKSGLLYELDDALKKFHENPNESRRLSKILAEAIQPEPSIFERTGIIDEYNGKEIPGEGKIYTDTNDYMITKLVELTWINDKKKLNT